VAWRAMAGFFTGTVANAFAYITDVVPLSERAKYISYLSATMSTCFVIGPMIGRDFFLFDGPICKCTVINQEEGLQQWGFAYPSMRVCLMRVKTRLSF
jgi:MFS family permease